MKRPLALCLALLFLTAHTSFGQWLKLPVLLHHYLEHRDAAPVSFSEFLAQHYADNGHTGKNKHPDHHKLPFKSDQSGSIVFSFSHPDFSLPEPLVYSGSDQCRVSLPQPACSQLCGARIWQPPRVA